MLFIKWLLMVLEKHEVREWGGGAGERCFEDQHRGHRSILQMGKLRLREVKEPDQ